MSLIVAVVILVVVLTAVLLWVLFARVGDAVKKKSKSQMRFHSGHVRAGPLAWRNSVSRDRGM
jgi:NADH:ubiquinone oxidoreductase subunit 3 (subunit A)